MITKFSSKVTALLLPTTVDVESFLKVEKSNCEIPDKEKEKEVENEDNNKSLGLPIDLSKLNTLNVFDKYVFFKLCIMSLIVASFSIAMIIITNNEGKDLTTWL
ncbi:hypothetical protein ACTFIR_007501 [Dictyostelium discoideum]